MLELMNFVAIFNHRNTKQTKHSFHSRLQLDHLRDFGGQWCHSHQLGK